MKYCFLWEIFSACEVKWISTENVVLYLTFMYWCYFIFSSWICDSQVVQHICMFYLQDKKTATDNTNMCVKSFLRWKMWNVCSLPKCMNSMCTSVFTYLCLLVTSVICAVLWFIKDVMTSSCCVHCVSVHILNGEVLYFDNAVMSSSVVKYYVISEDQYIYL